MIYGIQEQPYPYHPTLLKNNQKSNDRFSSIGRIFYIQVNCLGINFYFYPTIRILNPQENLKGFQINLHFICAKMMIIRNQ